MVCIAPWNFPLAIFGGQVFAALLTGNTVAAKPAPQTPHIARRLVALLHAVGVPQQVLACAYGDGLIGETLVSHPACAGVVFTGSVQTAKRIQQTLAQAHRTIVPLIAETGGINAMVVDSSALPEQVVDSVISSAFGSAGQRCSALRLLALHQSVAADMEAMLAGAMQTLQTGRPEDWSTDVGPVIDAAAHARLLQHIDHLGHLAAQKTSGVQLIAQAPCPATPSEAPSADHWITPSAWRLPDVASLSGEHFGPVLHVVHWGPGTSAPTLDDLIDQINQSGFGLTMGLHTRMDARMQHVAQRAHVGNLYVNRGMTGAVVGVQPFGGQGWSGTGPKAGGPLYLWRLITEQVISINTTAAGGNAALLTQFSC
jgi:delta-1-pyrroline-5-carboxylate dehydrogenase PutA-like protein